MIIEKVTLTNGEGMQRPATTIISTVECGKLEPGDLILTTAPLDTSKILEVKLDPYTNDVTIRYTSVGPAGVMTSKFHSSEKLSRVERASLN